MAERHFHIVGPDEAMTSFAELAEASGMTSKRSRLIALSVGPTNSLETLFLALKEGGPYVGAAFVLSRVMIAWLQARADRQITITRNEKDRIATISAKGYSPEELQTILEDCRDIIVYQPPTKKVK